MHHCVPNEATYRIDCQFKVQRPRGTKWYIRNRGQEKAESFFFPHSSTSRGKLGDGGGVLVVSKEIGRVVDGGIVYVVVATHSSGASVIVVHIGAPDSGGGPSVMVLHSDCEQAGLGGQFKLDVIRGVVGQAGLSPGTVKVVGRMSIVLVHPSGGGVDGPVHVMGGAQGGASQMVEV